MKNFFWKSGGSYDRVNHNDFWVLTFALLIVVIITFGGWKKAHFKILQIIEMFFEK